MLVCPTVGLLPATPCLAQCEVAKLTAADAEPNDLFGFCLALDGGRMVTGAYWEDSAGTDAGAVYFFRNESGQWVPDGKITADPAIDGGFFGWSVAISGDFAVVGAPGDGLSVAGNAYILVRLDGGWVWQARLVPSGSAVGDGFGWSVAIDGDTVVVGASGADDAGVDAGVTYVFERQDETWTEQVKLTAGDAAVGDFFGRSVAIEGAYLAVGAPRVDIVGGNSGATYVFFNGTGTWIEQQKLSAVDAGPAALFGASVALNGTALLIGSSFDDDEIVDQGSAYVFRRGGFTWLQEAKLTAGDGVENQRFGASVSIDGGTAVVGAYGDAHAGAWSGAAYVFQLDGVSWDQVEKLTASTAAAGDWFGRGVALREGTLLVGALFDDQGGEDAGAAYVFDRLDDDADGVANACDACLDTIEGAPVGSDGCGLPGACCFAGDQCIGGVIDVDCLAIGGAFLGYGETCFDDPDEDGAVGCDDRCPHDPEKTDPGACGCGVPDGDADADGVADCIDLCPDTSPGIPVDADGCPTLGACCYPVGVCLDDVVETACTLTGGIYQGFDTTCDDDCQPAGDGDYDGNGTVDLADFAHWPACVTGPGGFLEPPCAPFDFNGDSDIDLWDAGAFQEAFSGGR